ncbi:shikimate dehydrogenase [Deinococcus deserti]|uniref:Putative Shikimate 5-dehydrogenase n=1 Tax=Deinococcus deserti (strain DSM 17065 / CIP 109153 / LMG 22923 / VCD115) TaxID=546414 RepID=C1CUN7_DEIDV|nr:shikimate dehydrogenase [Deinococcus deserti]ACO45904.1 putative Shikimate 5-dehydrogenase [Deinococcus deserti VCD115]
MPAPFDTPLALIGHPPDAARALRALGLLAMSVPTDNLGATLEACRALHFTGAIVHSTLESHLPDISTPDAGARRVGRVDALAFAGGTHGIFALSDALGEALTDSGYATRGAGALLIGLDAVDLTLALPLARLGFANIGVAAETLPDAERAARHLPAGLRTFPVSRRDAALATLAERADLIVLTGGSLPLGLLQPYHTLADLTGHAVVGASGATVLDLSSLPARRLARQLEHATGQRFHAQDLSEIAALLH